MKLYSFFFQTLVTTWEDGIIIGSVSKFKKVSQYLQKIQSSKYKNQQCRLPLQIYIFYLSIETFDNLKK